MLCRALKNHTFRRTSYEGLETLHQLLDHLQWYLHLAPRPLLHEITPDTVFPSLLFSFLPSPLFVFSIPVTMQNRKC